MALEDAQSLLLPAIDGSADDAVLLIYIAFAFLGLRLAAERLVLPPLRRAFRARGIGGAEPDAVADKVFDDAYTSLTAGALVTWGWSVMLNHEPHCLPWQRDGCLAGWPHHQVPHAFRLYWLAYGGFYCYEMLGTVLGVGCKLTKEMVVHHLVTMVLMGSAYWLGLHRLGLMTTNLFDVSNPVLHAAKAINHTGLPSLAPIKDALFKLFALTFLVVRVVIPPWAIIWPCWRDGALLPPVWYYTLASFMTAVQLLQFFWFYKIVLVAVRGDAKAKAA